MDNLQKEYSECVAQVEELKKLIGEVGINDELRSAISNSISGMQVYIGRAKEYLENAEKLASEAVELNSRIYIRNKIITEIETLRNIYEKYNHVISDELDERLNVTKTQNEIKKEIASIMTKYLKDDGDRNGDSYEQLINRFDSIVSENTADKKRLNEVLKEMSDNKSKILGESEVSIYE